MAKMEFNTGIETLTIFLVSVVADVHGRALLSLRWKPGGQARKQHHLWTNERARLEND
jgi:hypothetical protein